MDNCPLDVESLMGFLATVQRLRLAQHRFRLAYCSNGGVLMTKEKAWRCRPAVDFIFRYVDSKVLRLIFHDNKTVVLVINESW